MKKFILILLIILAAGGTGLYFGWVQVPPEYLGLAHSSVTGIIDHPFISGRFYWCWQKLIPKSFTFYTLKTKPYHIFISNSFSLPGSKQIQEYGDFTTTVETDIGYTIGFQEAKNLFKRGIVEDHLDFFKAEISKRIAEKISDFTVSIFNQINSGSPQLDYSILDTLKADIHELVDDLFRNYGIKNPTVHITFTEIPQIGLYRQALSQRERYVESLLAQREEILKQETEYKIQLRKSDFEIDKLKKYGQLIQEYPEILKYLYLQKIGNNIKVLVLPQNEVSGFPKMLEEQGIAGTKSFIPLTKPSEGEIPSPEIKPKEELPPSPKAKEIKPEGQLLPSPAKKPVAPAQKKKWYEYLEFWKQLKKE